MTREAADCEERAREVIFYPATSTLVLGPLASRPVAPLRNLERPFAATTLQLTKLGCLVHGTVSQWVNGSGASTPCGGSRWGPDPSRDARWPCQGGSGDIHGADTVAQTFQMKFSARLAPWVDFRWVLYRPILKSDPSCDGESWETDPVGPNTP